MSYGAEKKTEHAGAKNGGGYWGRRAEAKAHSKVSRRQKDKALVREAPPIEEVVAEYVLAVHEYGYGRTW
jgi:RNA-splicing ligase RtcB